MTKENILELVQSMRNGDDKAYNKLVNGLTEDIRKEILKSKGTKVKDIDILKRCVCEERFNGYSMMDDYYCFTESHYFLCSKGNDFGYKAMEIPVKYEGFFFDDCFNQNLIEVDKNDLRLFIKTHKGEKDSIYIIKYNDSLIGFNPKFLRDCLDFCDTNIISIKNNKSLVYIKSKDNNRLSGLLPIHPARVKEVYDSER